MKPETHQMFDISITVAMSLISSSWGVWMSPDTNRTERDALVCPWGMKSGISSWVFFLLELLPCWKLFLLRLIWSAQLTSDGGTNRNVLLGLGRRPFDVKLEEKLVLKAKNSSGGGLFCDLKLWLLYYQSLRDPGAIYQYTSPYLPLYQGLVQTALLVNCSLI